ncbi:zinc finger protein ZAT9-like [Phalaenopsis equestris]|uniref:zinc finger protein ZAT9-like n=1 Tax=Phalaenopsis equestris TaxID=78828 RepID=UPI0009E29918|nr:zinc finger protein ZAT9-like [Phalaenopsis equestris]
MGRPCCNVCGRSFPTRRALGGHMRIHLLPNSDKEPMSRYGFRVNPRKTWKLMENENDMLCSKCGEKFRSWSSLFNHTKFHSETEGDQLREEDEDFEEKNMNSNRNGSYEEGGDGIETQSDSEVNAMERSGSLGSSIAYEIEQTAGAFCLMMLSRGAGSVTDSSDKASVVTDDEVEKRKSNSGFPQCDSEMNELAMIPSVPKFDFGINELEKIQSFPSVSEFSLKLRKSKASSRRKDLHYVASGIEKQSRYNCKTCGRTFPTYQALGGHRARHMRIKVPSFSEVLDTKELKIQNHGSKFYECSICGKIFASGQALGGHKRSHLVAADNAASAPAPAEAVQASAAVIANMEQVSSVFDTLDLNLPAMEDESYGDYDDMTEDSI